MYLIIFVLYSSKLWYVTGCVQLGFSFFCDNKCKLVQTGLYFSINNFTTRKGMLFIIDWGSKTMNLWCMMITTYVT